MRNALNDEGNYHCTICDYYSKHWNNTDKHMRIEHFKLKYGPCPFCNAFTTWNKESWRKHLKSRCKFCNN